MKVIPVLAVLACALGLSACVRPYGYAYSERITVESDRGYRGYDDRYDRYERRRYDDRRDRRRDRDWDEDDRRWDRRDRY